MLILRRAVAVLVAVLLAAGIAVGGSLLEDSHADAAPLRRTTTALSSSASPSAAGATVTFTAVVLRKGFLTPDPTSGTVTFYDGPNAMGTGTVGANHAATFATAALTPGSHSILAKFEGTVSYRASWSGAIAQVVNPPTATTTSVGSSLSPAQLTQSVTLTATVTAVTGTPEGSVAFADNGTTIAGCDAQPLSSGTATCITSALPIGSHDITGAYSGSPSHASGISPAFEQIVTALATTTTLSADINPATFGDVVTYTAVVAAPAGSAPTDGTVTFRDGADAIGSASLDTSAVASIAISTLGAGGHSITATFEGNTTHAPSTSTPLDQQVDQRATTTSVSLSPNPSSFGDSVTFTAHVTPDPGAGSVQFTIDGVDFGAPVAVNPGGSAVSDATSDLPVGDHTIAATFSGTADFLGSAGTLTQTVVRAEPSTDLDADVNPATYGDLITFTATVSAAVGTPSGTVTFQSDGTTIAGCDLQPLTAGVATCATGDLAAGTHSVTADYSGDDSYTAGSAAPLAQEIAKAATTTTVDADLNPSTFGAGVTFTASVTGVAGAEIPTGTVQFSVDGVLAGAPVTVAAGSASLVMSGLDAGAHTITAAYAGSENYETSTGAITQSVAHAETSTVVDTDVHPSVYGDAVTFTAIVSPHPASGTVQFTVDGTDLGSPVAVGPDGATVSGEISTLGTGDHEVVATFSGTANYEGSDDTITQTVTRADTTTTVTSDENPATYGETVTFTVTVAPQPVAGSVQLSIDGAPVGGPVALTAGTASLVGTGLSPGLHVIQAAFLGAMNYKASIGALTQTIVKVPSSTDLSIAPATPIAGAPLVLKATVSGSLSGSNPTGTVIFSVDGSPVGSPVSLSGAGIATMTIPAPAAGPHTAAAEYSGDPEYASSSASVSTSVTPVVKSGYWMVGLGGSVYAFGDVPYKGGTNTGNVVDIEPTRSGEGYWIATSLGGVLRFGDAPDFGDAHDRLRAGEHVVSMSATPSNDGYWLFTDIGRVIPFGAAPFLGDMAAVRLNGPVLGSVATPSGHGYYMVASDGGVFSFGDAVFHGSMGSTRLNQPVMGLVPDADNVGYWLVARDGGVFAFAAPFRGSMGGSGLNRPMIGMVGFGVGYLMVASDGGIFNYSDKPFRGSLGANPPAAPIVSVAAHAEP